MGLDMYLSAKRYIWPNLASEEDGKIAEHIKALNLTGSVAAPIKYLIFEVAYWRKQNAIHDWFVQNVQEGNDDCKAYYVNPDQLHTLQQLCVEVLAHPDRAAKRLPTRSGFFFGPTEYDDWYFAGLRYTADTLAKLLADPAMQEFDFEYQSSW